MCYVNFGGIGFTLDAAGTIPLNGADPHSKFRLIDLGGLEYFTTPAPATGWSQVSVVGQLGSCEDIIRRNGASDFYLGDVWVGSTEV